MIENDLKLWIAAKIQEIVELATEKRVNQLQQELEGMWEHIRKLETLYEKEHRYDSKLYW